MEPKGEAMQQRPSAGRSQLLQLLDVVVRELGRPRDGVPRSPGGQVDPGRRRSASQ
jgi:hypothetical protein